MRIFVLFALLCAAFVLYGSSSRAQDPVYTTPPGTATVRQYYSTPTSRQSWWLVRCAAQDTRGGLWFGSAGNSVYYYDGKLFHNFSTKQGLCHIDVLCCAADSKGAVWFGTRNGLIKYTPGKGLPVLADFSCIRIEENKVDASGNAIPYRYKIADNFVWSIMEDRSGKMWFGTNNGVYCYDPRARGAGTLPQFTRFLDTKRMLHKDGLKLRDVWGMCEDKGGAIWFVSNDQSGEGIVRWNGRSLERFNPNGVARFRQVMTGKGGELFFLNEAQGVYAWNGRSFRNFSAEIGLGKDTIVVMQQDRRGHFWFGTSKMDPDDDTPGGVIRWDGKALRRFTTKDGLSHNAVFCVFEDRKGHMWFGTRNTGLCRWDGKGFEDFTDKRDER